MNRQSRFRTTEILLLSGAHFIHDVYASFLAPLLPLLIEKFSITLAQAGMLSAIMQAPALLNPFIGMLADRMNLRMFVILAPMLTAVPMSMLGLAPTYGVTMLLLLLAGISVAMFHVPAPVMVARMAGNLTGTGMSFFMTGGELARTVGPVTAVSTVSLLGLQGSWPIMVAGIAASVVLFVRFRHVDIKLHSNTSIPLTTTLREMRKVLLPITFIVIARSFMYGCMTSFLPTFVTKHGGTIWLGGICLTMFEAAGVAGALTSGSLSDIIGRKRMLLISLVGAPLGLVCLMLTTGQDRAVIGNCPIISGILLLITGFMLLSTTPVVLAVIQEHAEKSPAAANGIYMMVSFIARSSVVVLIGFIGDHAGLYTAYMLSAAAGTVGIPFVLMLPSPKRA